MIRKTLKSLGKKIAPVASGAAFITSLFAYPFAAVFLQVKSLFQIWRAFGRIIIKEQKRTNAANTAAQAIAEEGGADAPDLLFQRRNSTHFNFAFIGKIFLRQIGLSLISPLVAGFFAGLYTLDLAKNNAQKVSSMLTKEPDFDDDDLLLEEEEDVEYDLLDPTRSPSHLYGEERQRGFLPTQRHRQGQRIRLDSDEEDEEYTPASNSRCTIS